MSIDLRLLGAFDLRVDGRPVDLSRSTASMRLLAYLALHRPRRLRRVHLAGVLWPDSEESRARRRLSHALWVLQSALADDVADLVVADRESMGVSARSDLWIDVEAFETVLDPLARSATDAPGRYGAEELASVLAHYRGDLLADHYDDWIEPRRDALRESFLLGQRHLLSIHKSTGDFERAVAVALRLVAEAPLSESAHAELVRAYWLAGRHDEADAQLERCRRVLWHELGVEPGPELVRLRMQIDEGARTRADGDAAMRPVLPDEPGGDLLVGRSGERARLLAVVDQAIGGHGGLALVEGPAGIGKSRILGDVADAARWRGAEVVWARHARDRHEDPYGGLLSALSGTLLGLRREQVLARLDGDWRTLAADLLPALAPAGSSARDEVHRGWRSPDERWRLQEALLQVVMALGDAVPTLLVLDDLHLADPESLEFLRLAAPRVDTGRVALVLGVRTLEARRRPELWSLLTEVEQRHRVVRVGLGGLGRADIARLVADRTTASVSAELLDELEQATAGNPLFVLETARWIDRGAKGLGGPPIEGLLSADGSVDLDRVLEVIAEQLQAADPATQRLVAAMAVWRRPLDIETLATLVDLDRRSTVDALAAAVSVGLVAETPDGFDVAYGYLADAGLRRVNPMDRRRLHGRAAELLAADPSVLAAELARHRRLAEQWREALDVEVAAARHAAALHAYARAADWFALATDSAERCGASLDARVLLDHEAVLAVLGRRDDQQKVLDRLDGLVDAPSEIVVEVRCRVASLLAGSDQVVDAVRNASHALALATVTGGPWRDACVTLAQVLLTAGRPQWAAAQLRVLGPGGSTDGQASDVARVDLALAVALAETQDRPRALAVVGEAEALFTAAGDDRGLAESHAVHAVVEAQGGAPQIALGHFQEALAINRRIGHRFGEGMVLTNLAVLHHLEGDLPRAMSRSEEAIEVLGSIGHERGRATAQVNLASLVHLFLGDDDTAERQASAARRVFEEIGDARRLASCLDILAGIRRRRRAPAVARRLLETATGLARGQGDRWLELQLRRSAAWNELEADRVEGALDAITEALDTAREINAGSMEPMLRALHARVLAAVGDEESALAEADRSRALESDGEPELGQVAALWRHDVYDALGRGFDADAELGLAHRRLTDMLSSLDADRRAAAIDRVPEHRRIAGGHAERFPRTAELQLPDVADPSGPPAVAVRWTVHHPDDGSIDNRRDRRLSQIARLLTEAEQQGGRPRIKDLADALDTSVSTIKRDLQILRALDGF